MKTLAGLITNNRAATAAIFVLPWSCLVSSYRNNTARGNATKLFTIQPTIKCKLLMGKLRGFPTNEVTPEDTV